MRIDLQKARQDARDLLAGLEELDGTELDDEARGRAPREQRAEVAGRLEVLAHKADGIRHDLSGARLSLRDRTRQDAPAAEAHPAG